MFAGSLTHVAPYEGCALLAGAVSVANEMIHMVLGKQERVI